ncbi:MAG TPA: hypothetical protein DDZ80_15200 [Cyanobacteria bacterium UBA8803]|nr:hypothetical protein [Cyanobacteria bacterium UBA9273]HBL59767.1 hypothetical protein [Cyanobacteria bacterium UBA8803]
MTRTSPKTNAHSISGLQLSLPLYQKPFLEIKKKVRGRNRKAFDLLQEVVCPLLETALDKNEIKSVEARTAIRDFLSFVQGAK